MASIYRSPASEAAVLALYDQAVDRLGFVCQSRMVETRFGATHVLMLGPEEGQPLLILHGGNMINPVTLAWYAPLAERYRLYAPDVIGQPGKSAPVRLSPDDDSYSQWMVDVLDRLGLEYLPFIGPSYGAGIILRTAAYAPQRISKAVLHVPAGIVAPPLLTLLRDLAWPLMLYRLAPNPARLRRTLQPMAGDRPINKMMLRAAEVIFNQARMDSRLPRPATREELFEFHAPTLVLAAQHDPLFPAEAVRAQARLTIPNLVVAECLKGGYHFPTPQEQAYLQERIHRFLSETRCPNH